MSILGLTIPDHSYTLVGEGTRKRVDKVFGSRQAAVECMYRVCAREGCRITRVWDDKHSKTYICDGEGVRFYICRE